MLLVLFIFISSTTQVPRTAMGISHASRTSQRVYEADPESDSPTKRSLAAATPQESKPRFQQPRAENPTFGTPEFASFSTPKRDLKRKRSRYELTPIVKRKMVFEQDGDEEQEPNAFGNGTVNTEYFEGEEEWEVISKEQRTESYGSFWELGRQFSYEEEKEQEGEIRKQLKF
jgi:hypothetical protein